MTVSILVLTEDSAEAALETLTALFKRICRLVDPKTQTQRIRFEPATADGQLAMRANRWKSAGRQVGDYRRWTLLVRSIATKLLETDGFVAFHVDGDVKWSDRARSENVAKFRQKVIGAVSQILGDRAPAHLEKLLEIVPYYSIEAWLYQNTPVAVELCQKLYSGRDVQQLEQWRDDPTILDDVERPKDQICLGAKHNLALTRTFPANEVHDAERSFHAVVAVARACAQLRAALAKTYA